MRSHFLAVVILITCSSFLLKDNSKIGSRFETAGNSVVVFTVHRLSGEKVFLSWHTEGESQQAVYEVLRKHEKLTPFVSLGVVQPKYQNDNSADYSFVDLNDYSDSSYYCLKKTNADSVIFYSITKGVEGIVKER